MQATALSRLHPWAFHRHPGMALAGGGAAALMAMPLVYVLYRGLQADPQLWAQLWQSRIPGLLYNTLSLALGAGLTTLALGVSLAWLVVRYDFPGRRTWTWLLAAPLSVPPYIMAFVYTELFAPWGPLRAAGQALFGPAFQPPSLYNNFAGVVGVMSLATFPYVYLLARASLLRFNRSFEESASLGGLGPLRRWWKVVLPLQRPGVAAGLFLVCLYMLSDFGAVSMLRYSTFTRAIYLQLTGRYDRLAAAALSVVLVVLSLAFFLGERHLRSRGRFYQTAGTFQGVSPRPCSRRQSAAIWCVLLMVFTASFLVVVAYLGYRSLGAVGAGALGGAFWGYAWNSLSGAAAAATLAVAAAFPIAYLRVREPRPLHNFFLRASYAGYVLPGPIVALGVIFFMLHLFPPFYGTVAALVLAYVVRFLPQCLQAEEASLEQVSPSIEEAGRSCGAPFGRVLRKVTLPLIAPGLLTGWVLVFVHAMRELPATLLLRPVGFDTLAVRIWIETSEEFYSMASPGALMLILVTLPLLALVLSRGAGSLGVRRPA